MRQKRLVAKATHLPLAPKTKKAEERSETQRLQQALLSTAILPSRCLSSKDTVSNMLRPSILANTDALAFGEIRAQQVVEPPARPARALPELRTRRPRPIGRITQKNAS